MNMIIYTSILLIIIILFLYINITQSKHIFEQFFSSSLSTLDEMKTDYNKYVDYISEYYTINYILEFIKSEINNINKLI